MNELKQLIQLFSPEQRISVENFDNVLYKGTIANAGKWKESNLDLVECEIIDNVLHIQVAV